MAEQAIDLPLPDRDETGPYALMGTARAKAGCADELERRLLALVAPTREEPGALAYHVHRDRADPAVFAFYEAWTSRDALRDHLRRPYIQDFLEGRHRVLDGDLSIRWLRMKSPFHPEAETRAAGPSAR